MFKAAAPTGADWSKATYVLPRNAAAIQVLSDELGRIRMGAILKLPEGAEVSDCGEGSMTAPEKSHGRAAFITFSQTIWN